MNFFGEHNVTPCPCAELFYTHSLNSLCLIQRSSSQIQLRCLFNRILLPLNLPLLKIAILFNNFCVNRSYISQSQTSFFSIIFANFITTLRLLLLQFLRPVIARIYSSFTFASFYSSLRLTISNNMYSKSKIKIPVVM